MFVRASQGGGGTLNFESGTLANATETTIFNKITDNAVGIAGDAAVHAGADTKLYFAVKDGVLEIYYVTNAGYGSIDYTNGRLTVKAKNMSGKKYYIMYE